MRILCDENVARLVVEQLKSLGHDVSSILEEAAGSTDEEVLRRAFDQGRIIVTHDCDFGNALRIPYHKHVGILLVRLKNQHPTKVAARLACFFNEHSAEQLHGRLVVLGERTNRFYPS